MDYKQVIFLESPATGKQARIILDGAQATTSTVNNIQVNPSYPGWFWIQTVSGSLYAGQLQSPDRTVFVSGGAAQHQVNNYNIQQSAEIQTSPFQSANEQRYINTAQSYRHQSQTPNWLPFLVAPAIFLFAIYVFGMQDPNLASLISYAIVIGSSIWVGIDSNSLCKRYGYLKLMIDGMTSKPFSAKTLPPSRSKKSLRREIIEFSRVKYGRPVFEIDCGTKTT